MSSPEVPTDENDEELSFVILNEDECAGMAEAEANISEEVNVDQETVENEIHEILLAEGLEDRQWVKKVQDGLSVDTIAKLKNVTKEQIDNFLLSIEKPFQTNLQSALYRLIGLGSPDGGSTNLGSFRNEHNTKDSSLTYEGKESPVKEGPSKFLSSLSQAQANSSTTSSVKSIEVEYTPEKAHSANATPDLNSTISQVLKKKGLDDTVWVPQIVQHFELKSCEQLKLLTKESVDVFVQSVEVAEQDRWYEVFESLSSYSSLDSCDNLVVDRSSSNVSLDIDTICRGIYLCEDINTLVQEREPVISVSECDYLSRDPLKYSQVYHQEFHSRKVLHKFIDHIDKHLCEKSDSVGVNIRGVDLENAIGWSDQGETYVGSVHYQLFPTKCVQLSPQHVDLRLEAIAALQNLEMTLIVSDYVAGDHVQGFFEIFGSHFQSGVVEFGGMLICAAECSGFDKNDLDDVAEAIELASERALFLDRISPSQSKKASEVLTDIPYISSKVKENITLTVKRVGGSQNIEEKIEWIQSMKNEESELRVIRRSSKPIPIPVMLQKYPDRFTDHDKLADIMMKVRTKASKTKPEKLIEEAIDTPIMGSAHELDKGEKARDSLFLSEEVKEKVKGYEVNKGHKEDTSETDTEKKVEFLRNDLRKWQDDYPTAVPENVLSPLRRLVSLRIRYNLKDSEWQREVVLHRNVQRFMHHVTRLIPKVKSTKPAEDYGEDQIRAAVLLRQVLDPIDEIPTNRFPNFRHIELATKEITKIQKDVPPFEVKKVAEFPDVWQRYKIENNLNDVDEEHILEQAQLKLESTIKHWDQTKQLTHENLVFIGVLQVFGFDITAFSIWLPACKA